MSWEAGRALVFDDSFLHTAINNSSDYRYVLYVTFWHPDLGPFQKLPPRPGVWEP